MEISVTKENLLSLLKEIRNQVISIDICTLAGKWLGQYAEIEEVKYFKNHAGHMTVLILHAKGDDRCIVIDVSSIATIKLNKYLNLKGILISIIRVHDTNELIEVGWEEMSLL